MAWVFKRRRDGSIQVSLSEDVRRVLATLPAQLEGVLLEAPDASDLARLAPPAYIDQPEHEEEYRRYMGDDLRSRQLDALAVLRSTADAKRLTEEQAQGWLAALNSLRLVLGTQLDVSEDDDLEDGLEGLDPESGAVAEDALAYAAKVHLYRYLSELLWDLVDALSGGLPPPREGTGA